MRYLNACGAGRVTVLSLLLGGSAAADQAPTLLSEKPPQVAAATQFQAGTSTIEPSLQISYRVLSDAANAAADRFAGPRSGTTRIGCVSAPAAPAPARPGTAPLKAAPQQGCADVDWHINAARNGSITAKRNGDGVALSIPVKFTGNGGFKGTVANALKMNNKPFSGTFVVTIAGVMHPDKSFCPRLAQPQTQFVWGTSPEITLIEKTCIGGPNFCMGPLKLPIGQMLTAEINRSLSDQVDAINGKISCDDVRNQLKQVWKTWSIPVTLANAPPFYATLEPKSLSIPGVIAGDDGVTVEGRLDVATSISADAPQGSAPPPLPANVPLNAPAGRFDLHVPLAVPYALLASAPSGNILNTQVKAGAAGLTPTAIEFYPSNTRLAVGVTFRADAPAKLAGRTATIWYTATPAVENGGHLITLTHLAMTKKDNNPLWKLAPALAALPAKITATYSYDLSPLVRDAQTQLNQAIADPKNLAGAEVKVANDTLKMGRIALLPNAFVVEGVFDADVSAALHGQPHS
jgi:hypothetical protein